MLLFNTLPVFTISPLLNSSCFFMHRVSSVGAYYITRSKSIIFFVVGKKKLCFDQFRHLLTLRINTRNAIYLINLLLCVLLVVN